MKKSYILMPNFDCPPQGPVALGRIITAPFDPESAINATSNLRPAEILRSSKTGFETLIAKESSGKYGLWTQFLGLSILGGEAAFDHSKSKSSYMYVSRLDTHYFIPTVDFVEESLRQPETLKELSRQKYEKNLYMITGIKTAVGAKMKAISSKKKGMTLKLGVDLTSLGAPIQVGPMLEPSQGDDEGTAFSESTDFVFAYRLREIYYTQKRGVAKTQDYTKGAAYGMDDDKPIPEDTEHSELLDDFEIDGIAEEDLGEDDMDELGQALKAVDDEDDEQCECYARHVNST